MSIGTFESNANSDTLFAGSANPIPFDAGTAYYYIDSVSLFDSLDYALINNIKKNVNDFKVQIYPNPTVGKLKVKIENLKEGNIFIKITDVLSREIKQLEYEEEVDISELEKGIYFLSLYQNEKLLTASKIIKQ